MNHQTHKKGPAESCGALFDSVDFGKFLSNDLPKTFSLESAFLSKEDSLPPFDSSSLFKSKESFSKLFSSVDWEMKYSSSEAPNLTHAEDDDAQKKKIIPDASLTSRSLPPVGIFSSREWMPMNTLGFHIDVPYSKEMFIGSDTEVLSDTDLTSELPPLKTDCESVFFSQLQLEPPPLSPNDHAVASAISAGVDLAASPHNATCDDGSTIHHVEMDNASPLPDPHCSKLATGDKPLKKRKRKPRKKVVPEVKEYVEPVDLDVLLGRGGRSNHHPGNKRYREEVKNLKNWYLGIEDKDEKTDLSQCLVDYVKSYGGRFLEKEKDKDNNDRWYVVPNIVARRKASQALREDDDPVKRAEKRARFLEKRAGDLEKKQKQKAT